MKRKEFVSEFVKLRRLSYAEQVKLGNMRLSEAVMGMADAKRDAIKCWNRQKKECK